MVIFETKQVKDMVNFTVNWRDIAQKLNPLYEDQGYAPPSDVQMQNAVLKAASILKPEKEKRSGYYYYESSFLNDAVEYIFKNQNFKLHKSEKYEARSVARKLTTEYLNAFDLLVTSSSALNLQQEENVEFNKTGWFNLYSLFNFLAFGDVNCFEEYQRDSTLRRSLSKGINYSTEYLSIMEIFALFMCKVLKDFDHIIISNTDESESKEPLIFYNILDFNKISQRVAEHLYLFIKHCDDVFHLEEAFFAHVDDGEVLFSLYEESVLDFVSNHKESSIQNGKDGKTVIFVKGDRYFWKQNL